MEIVAHRGASFDAPENTLAAVHLAWEQGADAVEIDVHLSRDGHVVAIHDDNTLRTGGNARSVAGQTLAELQSLDAGSWKDRRWAGVTIPTVAEVLSTLVPGKRLFVEIKGKSDLVPRLAEDVRRSGCSLDQIVFIGFSLPVLTGLQQCLAGAVVYWIWEAVERLPSETPLSADDDLVFQTVLSAGVQGLDMEACPALEDPRFVARLRGAGLKTATWTVDCPDRARSLLRAGVESITTNRPGWLRDELQRRAPAGRAF